MSTFKTKVGFKKQFCYYKELFTFLFLILGLESHMYASQWFLTVFTAKFPLYLVFRVLDVFLFDGFDAIFQVQLKNFIEPTMFCFSFGLLLAPSSINRAATANLS